MSNTGYKAYTNLEQYYLDSGVATGLTKPNSPSDPDYIAPFLDLTFCSLPSITPSVSVSPSLTPSISVTPSITPTVTPSVTPSISTTPSNTPSISVTPSLTPTISQTPSITPSISITPTISVTPSKTPSVTPSTSGGFAPRVIGVSASTQPCTGGTCDEYLGWSIALIEPVLVNTNYILDIELYQYNVYQYTYTAYGTIPAGQSYNSSDPCLGGGTYVGCNYTVNSVCVSSIDAPVNPSTYAC
jgi:hypothetical protein